MTIRTAQVLLVDGSTVTVREPAWCTGEHQQGEALVDLFHDGPETALTVATVLGPVEILHAALCQAPYTTDPDDRGTKVAVLLGGACYRFDDSELYALADALADRAVQLRALARRLTEVRAEEAGR